MGGYIRTTYRADGSLADTTILPGVTPDNAVRLGVIVGRETLPDGSVRVTERCHA